MRKLVILSFILTSTLGFTQKQQEELAVVKVKEIGVVLTNQPFLIVPVLDLKSSLEKGFKTANSKMIAQHFATNIDVSLLDEENLYSKSQAEQVLKTFFLENKPLKFTIIHQGNSATTKYYIGSLETENSNFRITVNIKLVAKKEFISHLTIETDN